MSQLRSEDVISILNELPNRIKIRPRTEGHWFMFNFEVDGHEYELATSIHTGKVSLTEDGEIVFEQGGRR